MTEIIFNSKPLSDAIKELPRTNSDAVLWGSILVDYLADPNPSVRFHIATSLRDIHPQSENVQMSLIEHLGDDDRNVRIACAQAIASVHPLLPPAQQALTSRLADEQEFEPQFWLAWALLHVEPRDVRAIHVLAKALAARNPAIRVAAAEALSELGARAAPALAALLEAVYDKNSRVREFSTLAISRIQAPQLIQQTTGHSSVELVRRPYQSRHDSGGD